MSYRATLMTAVQDALMHTDAAMLRQERVYEIMLSEDKNSMDSIAMGFITNVTRNNLMFLESLISDIENSDEIEL